MEELIYCVATSVGKFIFKTRKDAKIFCNAISGTDEYKLTCLYLYSNVMDAYDDWEDRVNDFN